MKLHHVQVCCPPGGEQAARRFYGVALGMTEIAKPPTLSAREGVWFRQPGCEVHVGVEEDFRPAAKAHPAFLVGDVDIVARRLAAHGFPVRWDADLPGYRRFYSSDGNGNRVEILTPA